MKSILPVLDAGQSKALYLQLYEYIKQSVLRGDILPEEKLPSLRALAKDLSLSVTTIDLAYQQLQVEGYIYSKPQSGYFVNPILSDIDRFNADLPFSSLPADPAAAYQNNPADFGAGAKINPASAYLDDTSFDFVKWKKCLNKILNDYPHFLLTEGDARGEQTLRTQIAKYVYQSRGVRCNREQVVISAGTQQLMSLLCSLLKEMDIRTACFEDPGYLRVRKIFSDRQFNIDFIPVSKDGIDLHALPAYSCAVYVTPSNQFPTGAVMPAGKRYELLEWARMHQSIIIEDDYDSELRYFGRPVPSLQGLDQNQLVVYLGSFSSTLFPAIKISYMILPERMASLFSPMRESYDQTCSKTEQLTLALYMEKGLYQTHIKKIRKLYAQKLAAALDAISLYQPERVKVLGSASGLHLLLTMPGVSASEIESLCKKAADAGLLLAPVGELSALPPSDPFLYQNTLIFYYTRIPLEKIPEAVTCIFG